MSGLKRLVSRLANLFRPGHAEGELSRELAAHLALIEDDLRRQGLSPEDAQRQARVALGGVEQTKELHRDARSFAWLDDARRDAGYAVRLLRRQPIMAATAALSLGVGIGANTAVFTVANALLLRPPAGVVEPNRLVDIGVGRPDGGFNPGSYPTYLDLRQRTTTLEAVYGIPMFPHPIALETGEGGGSGAERVQSQPVTTNYFTTLGVQPVAGRLFGASDSQQPGASPVVVVSHAFWQRRFNGDPAIIGRTVRLNGRPFEVIGVAPAGFQGTGILAADLWLPLTMDATLDGQSAAALTERVAAWLIIGARLKPDVSLPQAAAEVERIGRDLNLEHGLDSARVLRLVPSSAVPGNRALIAVFIGLLMAIAGGVLAVACANVAAVLLARAAARRREIAVRLAIGAGRSRLIRQLLMETAVLFGVGGLVGLALAYVLTPIVEARLPSLPLPVNLSLALDFRVFAFTAALTLVAALVSGLVPATQASAIRLTGPLENDAHGSARGSRLQSAFVLAQVTLSILLVAITGTFVRALAEAGSTEPGFESRGVEIASVDTMLAKYPAARVPSFWRELAERVRRMPGVESATVAAALPGGFESMGLGLTDPERPAAGAPDEFEPAGNMVEPGYFGTLRIPLLAGRDFDETDTVGSEPVVILGEGAARHFWPDESALGKYLQQPVFGTKQIRRVRVVGIVGDIKSSTLIDGLTDSFVYLPLQQQPYVERIMASMTVVARTSHGRRFADEIAALVASIDPRLQTTTSAMLSDSIALGLVPQRIVASVAGCLGSIGLLLAAIGIYGVTTFAVTRRMREFGIRIALGARRADIVRIVLRRGLILLTIGCAIGLSLGALAGRVLSVFLFGIPAFEPVTFAGTALIFAVAGLAASYGPARRATRVDPLIALRDE
jgi:putative ABC transport system permease protein